MAQRVVTVLQPWLPQYRVPFFETAVAALRDDGVDLRILYGTPPPEVAARGDALRSECAQPVPTSFVHVGGRHLVLHRARRALGRSDLVVLEQAIRNLETYPALLRAARGGPTVALWGHGRTYTKPVSAVEERLKRWLTRRASWFFAYTERGARGVVADGFDRARVTVVQNSIDTTALRAATAAVTQERAAELRAQHGLRPGASALYIGALDTDKRIPFLLDAAARIAARVPSFRLLVAGDGDDARLVRDAAAGGVVVPVGRADARAKAELAAVSDVMLMPGRVGLGVVDSFVLETPMITTDWPFHAPEFEYLDDGVNGVVVRDDVAAYADAVVALLGDRARRAVLATGCRESAHRYTLDAMVANFRRGVLDCLDDVRRSATPARA